MHEKIFKEQFIPREWTHEEYFRAKKKLKIGTKVEVRLSFGEEEGTKIHGKKIKGKVVEKYEDHFLVRVKAKNGSEWNESFHYTNLMDESKVKILKM